ncbi:hypothetical protein DLJ54_08850 [Corynebacterium heidelbergense]|uniref:GtrA/DPMS transmembrane domain-containing protein n=2 Tax=Corynebacterium heidelbergense TaxID=2055947 RepID=A0A364V3X4_9CORY|nr:hypothetical protein DLJ54_08850 [Corynebacterium heidelbergense]
MVKKLSRFGLVGIAGALFDYGSRALLISVSVNPTCARALSYAIGSTVAYLLNSYFTFDGERSSAEKRRAIVAYATCFALAVVVDHQVRTLVDLSDKTLLVSWIVSQAVATLVNFLLQSLWVFRRPSSHPIHP